MSESSPLAKAYVQIVPTAKGIGDSLSSALEGASDKAGKKGGNTLLKAIGSVVTGAAIAKGLSKMTSAITDVVKAGVKGYSEYEQLVGGVETLFGAGGKSLTEYANSVGKAVSEAGAEYYKLEAAQGKVLANAAQAYATAGMSANEYMETVTGFAAALNQSLGGDTMAAAEYANMAITDMADNANKMGSSMESIQNAYQGFAKQNFTMLDNLKLGYGGTEAEMKRLLEDAAKISGIEYDISSYADIVDAIHVVQTEMGITGTTAQEASSTISGSLNSMKAAWQNLLVGMADSSQSLDPLIDHLVTSATTFGENLIPVITEALSGVGAVVAGLAPIIIDTLPGLVSSILPGLLEAAMSIVNGIVAALPGLLHIVIASLIGFLPDIVQAGMDLFLGLIGALPEIIATITGALPEIIVGIVSTLANNIPAIVQAGVQLLVSLVQNLPAIIAGIMAAIPQIRESLVNGIIGSIPAMASAGYNLMLGLAQGISNAVSALWQTMVNAVQGIINGAKRLLGIASPSKVFAEIGGYTMEGFAEGILRNEELVTDAMRSASNLATGSFTSTLTVNAAAADRAASTSTAATVAEEIAAALRNVRVYIDGQRMVGYLVPAIDTALGVRQLAAERGAL